MKTQSNQQTNLDGPSGTDFGEIIFAYRMPVKPTTIHALGFNGSSRRAFSRPSSHEMPFGRFWRRRQPSGTFGGDFLTEGRSLNLCRFHSQPPRWRRKSAASTDGRW